MIHAGPYADLWLGEGQDFEKLDQNLKLPQNVKRGKRGGIYINGYIMMKNVPV